jgi:cell division cycle 2-like protein
MDFYNYDLRKLLEKYQLKFNSSEVKYLFRQLAAGVAYLHENILMHRDLKTENILINTTGQLKICDFGLSRAFNPEGRMKTYTPVVITLWYRPPELLLGPCAYSCEVDQWSVGCIFAELVRSSVLFAGNGEVDQVDKIFSIMGSPTDTIWPEYVDLPGAQKVSFRTYSNRLRTLVSPDILSSTGFDLLTKLLTYRPEDRITAAETLDHPYFLEFPDPVTSIDIDSKVGIFFNKNKS